MTPETNKPSPGKLALLLALLVALPAIGWSGMLEDFSTDYVNQAFTGAGLVYATARGINALVSVLQGTELDVVFLTVAVGEVLDPINDLIERFSGLVLVALGSLALQKLLLGIVSHSIFNALLSLLAVGAAFTLLRRQEGLYPLFLKVFLITAFLRFSLGLVVLANSWVDSHFLAEDDQRRHIAMEAFQGELREVSALAGASTQDTQLLADAEAERAQLDALVSSNRQAIENNELELALLEAQLDQAISADGFACIAQYPSELTCSAAVMSIVEERTKLAGAADVLALERDKLERRLEKSTEVLNCLQRRARGESCSWFERMTSALSPAQLRAKLAELEGGMNDFAENTIDLLVSLLLKSVAIPVVFFYLLLQVARMNWSKLP
jgi:hypothetical protein